MYKELGVRRVINGQFPVSRLGGSVLPKEVLDAMIEPTGNWCSIWELEERAGDAIARICGAEAAHVTSGAYAGLVLSAAACIAGRDPDKMRRLPDTTGMKNEIVVQRNLRRGHSGQVGMYDRSMEIPGGRLVEIGHEDGGVEPEDLETTIGEKTAAIHFAVPEYPESRKDIIPLEEVIEVGHRRGVPIIVDAAGQTYPVYLLSKFAKMGADLVCYAAKYIQGANSAGWVCGRKDLIETVALHSFIGQEAGGRSPRPGFYMSVGRGYKLDRQEIVGTLVALQRWVKMDHRKERIEPAQKRIGHMQDALKILPNLEFSVFPDTLVEGIGYHQLGLRITFEGRTAAEIAEMNDVLRDGDPSIWLYAHENSLLVNALFLADGDEKIVADRIKTIS